MLTILFLLLLLAAVMFLFRRRRASFALVILFLCGALLGGTPFVPSFLLSRLQVYPRLEQGDWTKRTAIFLLGAGGTRRSGGAVTSSTFGFSRVFEAARLFHDCSSSGGFCVVVPCGGDALGLGITEAEIMKRELVAVGVPEAAIISESRSRNTFQNALFGREAVAGMGFESLVLVTSGVHMARAMKFFTHFGLDVLPAPSDQLQAVRSFVPVAMNFFVMDLSVHELLGIVKFHVYNLMGWNAKI